MSDAPAASIALGVALFWASLLLYVLLLRARGRSSRVDAEDARGVARRE